MDELPTTNLDYRVAANVDLGEVVETSPLGLYGICSRIGFILNLDRTTTRVELNII